MTEKRFKNVEEKLYWGTVQYFTYNDEKITDEEIEKLVNHLLNQNEQLKEQLSTWRSSCCNYLNVYSILDNEVSILKETKDLDRFFEKFDKYSRMPFYEVEKSFIELQTENEQLKKDATTLIYANQDYRQQNQNLQKQLDYIQNSITNAIKHQKTELGVKALQEIIVDYNEWMLGHKEAKE